MSRLTLKLFGIPKVSLEERDLELGIKLLMLLVLLGYQISNAQPKPRTRDELAHWLWPETSKPLPNLSVALGQLRKILGANAFGSNEQQRTLTLNLEVQSDVTKVLEATLGVNPSHWQEAWSRWQGTFLEFPDPKWDTSLSLEFQDWLSEQRAMFDETRSQLAANIGQDLLKQGKWVEAIPYLETAIVENTVIQEQSATQLILIYTSINRPEQALLVYQRLRVALHEIERKPRQEAVAAFEIAQEYGIAAARALLEELVLEKTKGVGMPFVGRTDDLHQLEAAIPRSLEASVWLVQIRGEAGAGKTALLRHLIDRIDPTGRTYLHSETFGELEAPQWRALDRMARLLIRQRPNAVDSLAREQRMALARFLPDVLESIGDEPRPGDNRLLFAALRLLITHETRPTLLILDDAHWIDSQSLGLVLELLRKPPPRGLLVVLTRRDGEVLSNDPGHEVTMSRLNEWIYREKRGTDLSLSPLTLQAIAELTNQLGLAEADANWMLLHSGGNPLYLLEMIFSGYVHAGPIPTNLAALVQTRVAAFDTSTQEVLEACAILGSQTGLAEIKRVSGFSYELVVQAMARLRQTGILHSSQSGVQFNHELTRQAILQRLSRERGQLLHLRAAETRRDRPEIAADHFWQALAEGEERLEPEEMRAVVTVFTETAAVVTLRGDVEGGHLWFQRAFNGTPDSVSRALALTRRARVFERLSRHAEASQDLDHANLLVANADHLTRAQVLNARGTLLVNRLHDSANGANVANQALKLLEGLGGVDIELARTDALNTLGVAAMLDNDLSTAESYHRQALEVRRVLGHPEKIGDSLTNLANTLALQGSVEAQTLFDEAILTSKRLGNLIDLATDHNDLGLFMIKLGKLEEAEQNFQLALDAILPLGQDIIAHAVLNNLGMVRFFQGHFEEARSSYLEALEKQGISDNKHAQAMLLGNVVEAELRLTMLDDAQQHLLSAFSLLKDAPSIALEAGLHFYSGERFLMLGDLAQAAKAYHHALDAARVGHRQDREFWSLLRLALLEKNIDLAYQAQMIRDDDHVELCTTILLDNIDQAKEDMKNIADLFERSQLYQLLKVNFDP